MEGDVKMSYNWYISFYSEKTRIIDLIKELKKLNIEFEISLGDILSPKVSSNKLMVDTITADTKLYLNFKRQNYAFSIWSYPSPREPTLRETSIVLPNHGKPYAGEKCDTMVIKVMELIGEILNPAHMEVNDEADNQRIVYKGPFDLNKFKDEFLPQIEYKVTAKKKRDIEYEKMRKRNEN